MTRMSVAVLLACLAWSVATHAGRAPQPWTLDRLMTPAELQATGPSGSEVDPICSWELKPGVQVSLEESPIAFGEFHQRLVATDGVRALVRPDGPVEGSPPPAAGETPH